MINKKIDEINEKDLEDLIDNEILEDKTIEYKSELPGELHSKKVEFSADFSSFANASGGDIIYGISENRENGKPEAIIGIEIKNIDKEINRLENIIRHGIEPNIPSSLIRFKTIQLSNSKYVIIIRIRKSWLNPHRVQSSGRFYSRCTTGKYPLDVAELRSAFILSETIGDKIKKFRVKRISDIYANELPIPFYPSPKMTLHLIPITAFNPGQFYNLEVSLYDIQPFMGKNFKHRYNIDGLLTYSRFRKKERSYSYTQLYRNGIIETVNSEVLWSGSPSKIIPLDAIENALLEYLPKYIEVYNKLNIDPPFFLFLTLIDVRDYRGPSNTYPIDRDIVLFPDLIIENKEFELVPLLKPLFDLLWNAVGYKYSPNFKEY